MPKTFFILDDHAMMRHGIASYLSDTTDWGCSGSAESSQDALSQLEHLSALGSLPALVISDLQLAGDDSGLNFIGFVSKMYPDVKCICYSMYTNPSSVQNAINAGAVGYVSKSSGEAELLACMEDVFAGKTHIEQELLPKITTYTNALSSLTRRERQVLDMLLQKKSNGEISKELQISRHAVENYISTIYEKLDVNDRESLTELF